MNDGEYPEYTGTGYVYAPDSEIDAHLGQDW